MKMNEVSEPNRQTVDILLC